MAPLLRFTVLCVLFNCMVKCDADIYCIEEEADSVVADNNPDLTFAVDAPYICVSACVKWAKGSCVLAAYSRPSFEANGTCTLFSKRDQPIKVQKTSSSDSNDAENHNGSLFSVYRVLKKCRKLDGTLTAAAKKYIQMGGRRILNIEGRTAYGLPVEIHLDDWGPWSKWSECVKPPSVANAIASKNRIRICGSCGLNRIIEFETHNCESCPVVPSWGPWTACSVSCGAGVMVRRQFCPTNGLCDDGDAAEEARQCTMPPCPDWSPWGLWGTCIGRCGQGVKERLRHCVGFGPCPGSNKDAMQCQDVPPCCTDWFPVGECSATCGSGIQLRARKCEPPNHPMTPHLQEAVPCNVRSCDPWAPCVTWTSDNRPIINLDCMTKTRLMETN